jgi:hypothetical protein
MTPPPMIIRSLYHLFGRYNIAQQKIYYTTTQLHHNATCRVLEYAWVLTQLQLPPLAAPSSDSTHRPPRTYLLENPYSSSTCFVSLASGPCRSCGQHAAAAVSAPQGRGRRCRRRRPPLRSISNTPGVLTAYTSSRPPRRSWTIRTRPAPRASVVSGGGSGLARSRRSDQRALLAIASSSLTRPFLSAQYSASTSLPAGMVSTAPVSHPSASVHVSRFLLLTPYADFLAAGAGTNT